MKKEELKTAHFAICLDNEGYKASLEVGKLYRVVPDGEAEENGYIRVVDESGEDYAFSSERFHLVVAADSRKIIGGSSRLNAVVEQVSGTDCSPACLSSTLCGFFEVACNGRLAAQFQRSASSQY